MRHPVSHQIFPFTTSCSVHVCNKKTVDCLLPAFFSQQRNLSIEGWFVATNTIHLQCFSALTLVKPRLIPVRIIALILLIKFTFYLLGALLVVVAADRCAAMSKSGVTLVVAKEIH